MQQQRSIGISRPLGHTNSAKMGQEKTMYNTQIIIVKHQISKSLVAAQMTKDEKPNSQLVSRQEKNTIEESPNAKKKKNSTPHDPPQ